MSPGTKVRWNLGTEEWLYGVVIKRPTWKVDDGGTTVAVRCADGTMRFPRADQVKSIRHFPRDVAARFSTAARLRKIRKEK